MDDSDELGGLSPTTPAAAAKRKKPTSRSDVAGPSSKPAGGAAARKKSRLASGVAAPAIPVDTLSDSDIQEIPVQHVVEETDEEEGDEEEEEEPQERPARKNSRKPAARGKPDTTNSRPKGKGKTAVVLQSRPARKGGKAKANATEDVEIVHIDEDDGMERNTAPMDIAAAYNAAANSEHRWEKKGPPTKLQQPSRPAQDSKLLQENARLKSDLQRMKAHFDDLKVRFEEMVNIRQTEAEALLDEQEQRYQAQVLAQKDLIADLHTQLAKKEPLLRPSSGKKAVVALLTREEADEETKVLRNQILALKNEVVEVRRFAEQKDEEIAQLKQRESDLQIELKAEIDRSTALATRVNRNAPPSATRGGNILGSDDPKTTKVITLYEDLTNVLVSGTRCTTGKYDTDEWVFNCVYTHVDILSEEVPKKNLNFMLRMAHEPPDGQTSRKQLVEMVHFLPMELDKEPPEFVKSLGFLGQPFSFQKSQLSLFVRTLYDNINNESNSDGGDSD